MNKVKWLLPILAVIFFASDSAFACSCIGPADAKKGLVRAKAVFSGKVIAVDGADVTFQIERIWKGVSESEIVVRDYHARTSCAFNFKLGERYVVFATTSDYEGKTILIGDVCNWTSRSANAKEVFKMIGKGKPVKSIMSRSKARTNSNTSNVLNLKAKHNNSLNRSGISLPFIRQTRMLGSMLPARLIRALGR